MADEERYRGEQRLHHRARLAAGRAWCPAFGVCQMGQDGASVVFGVSVGRRGLEVGKFVIATIGHVCDVGYSSAARKFTAAH